MLLLFFLAWVIFNGRLTVEIALFGIAISAVVFLFICKFMGYSFRKELNFYRKAPIFLQYCLVLLKEIVLANLTVCQLVLTRKEVVEPVLVHVATSLKTDMAKTLLANAITLTPGTITVSVTGQKLLVHCLDKSLAQGMEDSEIVRILERLEGIA
ncbi:MAG: sodium:proton antiporter [Ruminococcaceae bacterium]|nr:sodium:proton antiporter [Oscillospiraceae bacterium]